MATLWGDIIGIAGTLFGKQGLRLRSSSAQSGDSMGW
jgi:hypothetical protein